MGGKTTEAENASPGVICSASCVGSSDGTAPVNEEVIDAPNWQQMQLPWTMNVCCTYY